MGVKLSTAKIKSGNRERLQPKDFFDLVEFPDHELYSMRPVGEIVAIATHWFEVITKEGKKTRIGKTCRNVGLDGETHANGWDGKGPCYFCKVGHESRQSFFQNFILPDEEENAPRKMAPPTAEEKKNRFKIKGTKLWTPIKVLQFPPTVATTMQMLTKKNKDKAQEVRELSDPVFGKALDISRDTRKGVAPANMWNVQKADVPMRKLSEEQRRYYLWDLNLLAKMIPSVKESKADLEYNIVGMIDADYEKLDLSDFPELIAKREKKNGKKSKNGKFRMEEEEDDDLPKKKRRVIDDEDDEDDDLPRRKKSSSKRRDEEDEPRSKKKKKKFNIESLF